MTYRTISGPSTRATSSSLKQTYRTWVWNLSQNWWCNIFYYIYSVTWGHFKLSNMYISINNSLSFAINEVLWFFVIKNNSYVLNPSLNNFLFFSWYMVSLRILSTGLENFQPVLHNWCNKNHINKHINLSTHCGVFPSSVRLKMCWIYHQIKDFFYIFQ